MALHTDNEQREARQHHHDAQATEAAATARAQKAEKAHDAAMRPLLRRPNPKRVDAAGAELDAADAAALEARANVRRSAERLAALQPDAVAEARIPRSSASTESTGRSPTRSPMRSPLLPPT